MLCAIICFNWWLGAIILLTLLLSFRAKVIGAVQRYNHAKVVGTLQRYNHAIVVGTV